MPTSRPVDTECEDQKNGADERLRLTNVVRVQGETVPERHMTTLRQNG